MPNWCENTATLFHDNPEMLTRASTAVERQALLQEFVPMPEDIGDGWWDWALANWGTKWDIDEGHVVGQGDGFVTIAFLSAWSPPVEAYKRMERELGFRVEAEYAEPGMCFRGTYQDGVEHTEEMDEDEDEA